MNRKSILAILTCLMMLSSFAASLLPAIVQAEPDLPTITLWGVRTADPFWGYYGGYHDMWDAIKPELLKIGIDLKIETFDAFTFEGIFYDDWNISGDPNNDGVRDGWDFATREWWLNPTSHVWLDEMVLGDHVPEWNVNPMMNEEADYLYREALKSVGDPERYKQLMWLWQEEFMHDPPLAAVYYAEMMTARGAYFDGYDDTSWLYGLREVRINQTVFDAVAPASRKAVGNDTWIWGAVEPVKETFPTETVYYTEEAINALRFGMLYRGEREHMNFTKDPAQRGEFRVHPDIAADFLTWYDAEDIYPGEYDAGMYVARMPIREGIYWSDGWPCNATDVAYTFNVVMDPAAGVSARTNYYETVQEAVVFNATTVDFICYVPRYELEGLLAQAWALPGVMPYHQLKALGIENDYNVWEGSDFNKDAVPVSLGGDGLEVIGPYVPVSSDLPAMTYMEFERFDVATGQPWYWDSQTMPAGTDNEGKQWGWALPENFIIKVLPDAADRLIALQTLAVDFAEYPTAPIETWEAMDDWDTHHVHRYKYPSSNPLWFNLNNPVLSNRYVRLAICHAIPYSKIFNEILPGWGVGKAYPGKTYVTPLMEAFNTELEPYSYDIDKAKEYMAIYWNSLDKNTRTGNDAQTVVDNSPVGDADFSGLVDLTDFLVWRAKIGTTPSNYYQYIFGTDGFPVQFPAQTSDPHGYWMGNDVDPDFDNKDDVDALGDLPAWADNFGVEYPFPGAR